MRAELALALALLAGGGTAAAAEPPRLELELKASGLRVGDPLPLTVRARGGEDLAWGGLEVAAGPEGPWAVVEGPRELAGARPPAWELVVAPLAVGELELPAIAATVREPGGAVREVAAAAAPPVTVASVLPEGEEAKPLPLRDPIGVGGFPWEWVLPLAVPVLGLAAGLAWWRRRRRGADGAGAPEAPPLAELERLLEALERRLGREPGDAICDRLAAGLRRYLARGTGEPAEDMTSFELRLLARRLGWPERVQRGIQEAMGVADRTRFGRAAADEAGLRRAIASARDSAREIDRLLAAAAAAEEAAG